MDPHVDSTPGLGLPQPSPERGAAALGGYQEKYHVPEAQSVVAEMTPSLQSAAPPLTPMAQASVSVQLQAATAVPQGNSTVTSTAIAADDSSDDLDEEWINKAKAIVEQTKADPYIESHELSKAKADYLRIRYNKQIKVAEDRQQ
jgi:hypothetical protein